MKKRIILIAIIAIGALVGIGLLGSGPLDRVINSDVENKTSGVTYVNTSKQYYFGLPDNHAASETSTKQTIVFPVGSKISSGSVNQLLDADVLIIDVLDKKGQEFKDFLKSYSEQIKKTNKDKPVDTDSRRFGNNEGAVLEIKTDSPFSQILVDAPNPIVISVKKNRDIATKIANSITPGYGSFAPDVSASKEALAKLQPKLANKDALATAYTESSAGLKGKLSQDKFISTLSPAAADFANNDLSLRAVLISNDGNAAITEMIDKTSKETLRKVTFYLVTQDGKLVFDGIRIPAKSKTN